MNLNTNVPIMNVTSTSGPYVVPNLDNTIANPNFYIDNSTTLRVDGTLEVNGRDVMKELDEMRDALLLLKRDVDMEAKYPKLRELKDAYERELEKYKTFERLK